MLTVEEIKLVDCAEALFASAVATGTPVTTTELNLTIAQTMLARGGAAGCAAAMATAYGENPAHAAERMRWALRVLNNERDEVTA